MPKLMLEALVGLLARPVLLVLLAAQLDRLVRPGQPVRPVLLVARLVLLAQRERQVSQARAACKALRVLLARLARPDRKVLLRLQEPLPDPPDLRVEQLALLVTQARLAQPGPPAPAPALLDHKVRTARPV